MTGSSVEFERLVAYASGELPDREAAETEAALAASAPDAGLLLRLRSVIEALRAEETDAPESEVIERVLRLFRDRARPHAWLTHARRVVADLVFDSRAQPALAGFRGTGETHQLAYESPQARIDIQVSALEARSESSWRLRGQIASEGGPAAGPLLVLAAGTDDAVAICTPDEAGRFRVDLPTGSYDLVLDLDEEEAALVLPGLTVGAPGER